MYFCDARWRWNITACLSILEAGIFIMYVCCYAVLESPTHDSTHTHTHTLLQHIHLLNTFVIELSPQLWDWSCVCMRVCVCVRETEHVNIRNKFYSITHYSKPSSKARMCSVGTHDPVLQCSSSIAVCVYIDHSSSISALWSCAPVCVHQIFNIRSITPKTRERNYTRLRVFEKSKTFF